MKCGGRNSGKEWTSGVLERDAPRATSFQTEMRPLGLISKTPSHGSVSRVGIHGRYKGNGGDVK